MGHTVKENLPEIVFASSESSESRRIRRWVSSGQLRKLVSRVYTSNSLDDDADIVRRNLFPILSRLFPGALLSHRTALDSRPTDSGDLFLTYKYFKNVTLPGIRVHLLKGPGPIEGDSPFLDGLFISSRPRALLECLQISRTRSGESKSLSSAKIEERLDDICRVRGVPELNRMRDEARRIASVLGFDREFNVLSRIISAILRTRPATELSSDQARARSNGMPYDPNRLDLFGRLLSQLSRFSLPARYQAPRTAEHLRNFAFFEAYFSNYIEGTEFELSEAFDIVFHNKIPENRPQDAHDILGTYRVVSNRKEMSRTPESLETFVELLTSRHHTALEGHPQGCPGEFKDRPNRAGETHFVDPALVRGTLLKGLELSSAVEPGLPRAIFMMFLVAEVHPFEDGNGRVARIMMNAELENAGLSRIIVPTVFRDDYLLALRALSRSDNPAPLCKALDFAQEFSAVIDMSSYDNALRKLTESNAFREPDEARLIMPV